MTDTQKTIAVVRAFDGSNAYEAFLDALEKRRATRNVSGITIDAIAGLAEGLTSKIMAGAKSFGPRTFGPMLGALGLGVILFEDPQALEYVARRHEKSQRNGAQVRMLANASMRTTRWLFTPRKGRKAAKKLARSMTPKQRKERARHAAMKRWRKPKLVEITNADEKNAILEAAMSAGSADSRLGADAHEPARAQGINARPSK